MPSPLGGTGVGLPLPQYLYPSELLNAPYDAATNHVGLYPGDALVIPAGNWWINPGLYSFLQYNDPIMNAWRGFTAFRGGPTRVKSDGVNFRIANLTGCPISAVVLNSGSGYAQATTTVTPSSGNSTWQPIVGGQVSIGSITNAGSGYGVAPILLLAAPPSPGVPATGHCIITGGSVTSIVLDNVGAGYVSAPTAVIVPSPFDPNINTGIVTAVVNTSVIASGSISAVICTNPGNSISAIPTLTIAGAGSGASLAALRLVTLTAATVSSSGTWTGGAYATSVLGNPATTAGVVNPICDLTGFVPRQFQAFLSGASSSLTSISQLIDGGLFLNPPTPVILPVSGNFAPASSIATVTGTYNGNFDTTQFQPAP